jgi:hypothetical protein
MLGEAPAFAAPLLAQRGEWRAVPDLVRALDTLSRCPVARRDVCHAEDLAAIGQAVLALGGTLSDEHVSRIDEAFYQADPIETEIDDERVD